MKTDLTRLAEELNDTILTMRILRDEIAAWQFEDSQHIGATEPITLMWSQGEKLARLRDSSEKLYNSCTKMLANSTSVVDLQEALEGISGVYLAHLERALRKIASEDITINGMFDLLTQLGLQELEHIGEILPAIGKVYIESPPIDSCPVIAPDGMVFFVAPNDKWTFTTELMETSWKYNAREDTD